MASSDERLAVLETQHASHKETLTDVVEQLKTLNTSVNDILLKLSAQRGFIAGMAFVFSLLGAGLALGLNALLKHLS